MKYYVQLHANGRPSDLILEESYLDLDNHIIADQHVLIGEFENVGDATDAYWNMVEPDDAGFYQWKK